VADSVARDFTRFIYNVLISLRRTLEVPFEAQLRQKNNDGAAIQLFVGQFPEWNKFLENAASAQFENDDIVQLKGASEVLIDRLKERPDLVDPEVPRTLSYLTQLLENPAASGKKAAFAVLRSIENLISLIFTYGAEFGQKTASKSIETASTAASKIIVITLLTLALGGAASIGPIASRVPEMSWLQTASEIVKNQLKQLSKE
jgi:hypothetical protein